MSSARPAEKNARSPRAVWGEYPLSAGPTADNTRSPQAASTAGAQLKQPEVIRRAPNLGPLGANWAPSPKEL